ncbi:MAG: amino acid ABC transporter permease [Clostridia bacterium]|nr:amino acid ABC transporter permease [Clostridia bacterium]
MQYFISVVQQIGSGITASLLLFILTLVFSMPLGLLVCFGRMSKFRPLSAVTSFIISILRGTPLMLQLVVVFFGPYYLLGIPVSNAWRFWAAIVGFSINYAAYFAEIYRSGIQSIPKGQYEAAEVLGYNRVQTFCKIIFPQMVKRVLPPVTNEIITLTKDTSLAFALAYAEMFTLAKQVAAADASMAPLFVAGLFYYVFNYVVAFVMDRVERKLAYYR